MRSSLVPSAAILLLLALPATMEGQARSGGARDTVPLTMLPPAGKCRIWMDGVPAAQQPAPTDCSTALRQRPANGTILYGPAARETSGGRFDPSVGERDPRTAKPAKGAESVERNGSDAEQELQRRRERAERDKMAADLRERDERARRDAAARARLMSGTESRGGNGRPAANSREGSTASPRGGTKAEPPPKPPAEPVKKKPE